MGVILINKRTTSSKRNAIFFSRQDGSGGLTGTQSVAPEERTLSGTWSDLVSSRLAAPLVTPRYNLVVSQD